MKREVFSFDAVAPARERGLKFYAMYCANTRTGRSRKGAWIEIEYSRRITLTDFCRSRKGAWIEISNESDLTNVVPLSLPQGSVD